MKISDMYPSRFMKAEDFGEGEVRTLTIIAVEMEELGQGQDKQRKPVITFMNNDKQFVLNKTNAVTLQKLYGDDTDEWIGKRVSLVVVDVQSFGEMVLAIRIRAQAPKSVAAPLPAPEEPTEWDALGSAGETVETAMYTSNTKATPPGYVAPPAGVHVPSKGGARAAK